MGGSTKPLQLSPQIFLKYPWQRFGDLCPIYAKKPFTISDISREARKKKDPYNGHFPVCKCLDLSTSTANNIISQIDCMAPFPCSLTTQRQTHKAQPLARAQGNRQFFPVFTNTSSSIEHVSAQSYKFFAASPYDLKPIQQTKD
jgi:hypothetical protein